LSWHGDFWRERRVRNQQSTDYADLRRFFFGQNGASGASDIEGKGAQGSTERVRAASEFQFTEFYGIKSSDQQIAKESRNAGKRFRQNGANGMSDIEGKGARGSTERARAASEFQFTELKRATSDL